MQVGVVAVPGPDRGHAVIGAVVDHVFALAEADPDDASLPPGEHGPSFVLLDLEVGCRLPGCERVKPHQVAALVGDHRPRRAVSLVGREEQVTGTRAGPCCSRDAHGRGRQRGRRAVVLDIVRVAGVDGELLLAHRRLMGDRECRAGRLRGACRTGARLDRHTLSGEEGMARKKALAGSGRVGAQNARVDAAARAHDANARHLRARPAEEADLGGRRGIRGTGQGRDRHRIGRGRCDRRIVAQRR